MIPCHKRVHELTRGVVVGCLVLGVNGGHPHDRMQPGATPHNECRNLGNRPQRSVPCAPSPAVSNAVVSHNGNLRFERNAWHSLAGAGV